MPSLTAEPVVGRSGGADRKRSFWFGRRVAREDRQTHSPTDASNNRRQRHEGGPASRQSGAISSPRQGTDGLQTEPVASRYVVGRIAVPFV